MFGVININKPSGLTSHDVVARVRRVLNIKKVGHAGTLDPLATGVLPIYVGSATRLLEFAATNKTYDCRIVLGRSTETWDAEGDVDEQLSTPPTVEKSEIEAVLGRFMGTIEQRIPKYSAKKVGGKKLYELARAGEEVILPTKEVTITSIDFLGLETDDATGFPVVTIRVACSTGTFMRTLAVDVGQALGFPSHLGGLIRVQHGLFKLDNAVDLALFMEKDEPQQYLESPLPYLDIPVLSIEENNPMVAALCQGTNVLERHMITHAPQLYEQVKRLGLKNKQRCMLATPQAETPIAVAEWRNHALKPAKVFTQQA